MKTMGQHSDFAEIFNFSRWAWNVKLEGFSVSETQFCLLAFAWKINFVDIVIVDFEDYSYQENSYMHGNSSWLTTDISIVP